MNNNEPILVQPKPFWHSKTMWINVLTVAAMILSFAVDTNMDGGLPFSLDPRWISLGLGVINIVLRSVTNAPVASGNRG